MVYQAGNGPKRKEGFLAEGSNLGALCLLFPKSSYTMLSKSLMLQISRFIMSCIVSVSRVLSLEGAYGIPSIPSGLVQNSILRKYPAPRCLLLQTHTLKFWIGTWMNMLILFSLCSCTLYIKWRWYTKVLSSFLYSSSFIPSALSAGQVKWNLCSGEQCRRILRMCYRKLLWT